MDLKRREKIRLMMEAVITTGIIILVYFAVFVILRWVLQTFSGYFESIWFFGDFLERLQTEQLMTIAPFLLVILITMVVAVVYWRLKRRHRQYELQHIIDELHYIAQGNYTHRIRGQYRGDLKKVVDSIHMLVDSTLEAMEEERRIEQSKDELITNVSHDIRTPLTSIIGYLSLVEEGRYQSVEELTTYTHTAYEKAKQMKVMVDDLFEYTKVRQTTTPLNITDFDIVQLLEQLAADFELEASEKGMELSVHASPERLMMRGDPEKLVRVFNNLLTNAFKYGKDGDKVLVDVGQEGPQAKITVSNNGQPIPEKSLRHLFERFYRGEESRSQETSGTGLGLAIAKSIVELHGGTIQAKTENGWTQFHLLLPLYIRQKTYESELFD
ncbi:sensor histidine kinase [Atopococcus tabaci]|uniref:sensor histidine kinase n=1 Tax=Atopococcus tabaci TaxID=269774 RepID=UPI0004223277|nr:HAMP domain-containing sensor histidine kinase [Atopococcus tabaci]